MKTQASAFGLRFALSSGVSSTGIALPSGSLASIDGASSGSVFSGASGLGGPARGGSLNPSQAFQAFAFGYGARQLAVNQASFQETLTNFTNQIDSSGSDPTGSSATSQSGEVASPVYKSRASRSGNDHAPSVNSKQDTSKSEKSSAARYAAGHHHLAVAAFQKPDPLMPGFLFLFGPGGGDVTGDGTSSSGSSLPAGHASLSAAAAGIPSHQTASAESNLLAPNQTNNPTADPAAAEANFLLAFQTRFQSRSELLLEKQPSVAQHGAGASDSSTPLDGSQQFQKPGLPQVLTGAVRAELAAGGSGTVSGGIVSAAAGSAASYNGSSNSGSGGSGAGSGRPSALASATRSLDFQGTPSGNSEEGSAGEQSVAAQTQARLESVAEASEARPKEPLRDFSVRLSGPNQERVNVRLTDRAGEVKVTVRSNDQPLNTDLRKGLEALNEQLGKIASQTESQHSRDGSSRGSGQPGAGADARQHQQEHRRRSAGLNWLESTTKNAAQNAAGAGSEL